MVNIDLNDLTTSALKRLVTQLLAAKDGDEKKVLSKLNQKNDLADLDEEKHGKPNTPMVEDDDDAFDLEASGGGDESESDMPVKKKGKK
jgi:hypothetical protein